MSFIIDNDNSSEQMRYYFKRTSSGITKICKKEKIATFHFLVFSL